MEPLKINKGKKLQPALITSFSIKGSETALKHWPANIENVELYAFMHSDLTPFFKLKKKDWLSLFKPSKENCALCRMADAWEDNLGEKVAARVHSLYKKKKIVALATFLPEITAFEDNAAVWKLGQKACMFLVSLARHLKQLGHPISTIHLSGGSRTDGVVLEKDAGGNNMFFVKRIGSVQAINRLLERLKPIADFAAQSPRIHLALELEPGPWYTVGDRKSLKKFCELVETHEEASIRSVVGVNLDIPHWAFLSRIDIDWLLESENKSILNRVLHCHISDHSIGHFGCTTIGSSHNKEDFGNWIGLISKIIIPQCPNFSGYISCEMEGCKDARFIRNCTDHLVDLIRRHG
jgi:hypothetical protein